MAADDSLVLGHVYRAYLQLYRTTPEGVAAADDALTQALVTERVARKPAAEPSARQLVIRNGGTADALRW